jgi:hypothetical protein
VPRPAVRTALTTARALAAAAGLLLAAGRPLPAQSPPVVSLGVRLSADSTVQGARVPVVRSENLLADGRWLSTLRSGLPVRLHYRLEIWRSRGGWLDLLTRQTEWDVVVRHEPLLDQYTLLTLFANRAQERRYATVDALSAALAFSYQVNVRPSESGRYYYTAVLEVSTLSDSDLDELERFLDGDLGDVAQGRGNVGDALGRGATRFLLRLAGLPSLRLEARSPGFEVR